MLQPSRHARATAKRKPSRIKTPVERGRDSVPIDKKAYAYVAHRLGCEIVGGTFPPGTLLPKEAEMRTRFAVSRPALREAYSVLAAKGLILPRPKIGTRVRPKTDWNTLDPEVLAWHLEVVPSDKIISDVCELCHIIEPTAAALVAAAPSEATIEQIGTILKEMAHLPDGAGDPISADLRFHLGILNATGNHFVGALGNLIYAALFGTLAPSREGATRICDDRLNQYDGVFEAICDRKPELARQRMDALLTDSLGDVRELLRRRDKTQASPRRRQQAGSRY